MVVLTDLPEEMVSPTNYSKKLTLNGETKAHYVFRIRLDLLYFNDRNDRIATWISKYEHEHGPLRMEDDREAFNDTIQGFIKESNPEAMEETLSNIRIFGQREPGVVLNDGRVIDGNRRFTCLRELSKEGTEFNFFEAVILEGNYSPTDKAIKTLELNIQIGSEKPVDYDPIERLYAVHRDVIDEKTRKYSKEEYARETNVKKSDLDMMIEKAKLLAEFLQFIEADDRFYIGRELKLDGPLQEAVGVLKKCRDDDSRERMKKVIFANLLMQADNDMTRYIRRFKKVVGTSEFDSFLDEQEDLAIEVCDEYKAAEAEVPASQTKGTSGNGQTAGVVVQTSSNQAPSDAQPVSGVAINDKKIQQIRSLRSNDNLKRNLIDKANRSITRVEQEAVRDSPYKFAEKALNDLEDVDLSKIRSMDVQSQESLSMVLDRIEERIGAIRERL